MARSDESNDITRVIKYRILGCKFKNIIWKEAQNMFRDFVESEQKIFKFKQENYSGSLRRSRNTEV